MTSSWYLKMKYDGDKELGKYTFRQISIIDYSLVTVDTFSLLRNFNVLETDPIFSDGHSILSCTLSCADLRLVDASGTDESQHKEARWNEKIAHNFINHVDREEISSLLVTLDSESPSRNSINEVTEGISNIFQRAHSETFPTPRRNNSKRIKLNWFGPCCKTARRKYHLARKYYNTNKTDHNRTNLIAWSRQYKKIMNKYIAKHKKYTQNKLRNLESKNPKDYWKFINSLKKKEPNNIPRLDDFYEHFKKISTRATFSVVKHQVSKTTRIITLLMQKSPLMKFYFVLDNSIMSRHRA